MDDDSREAPIAVFDIGGTWFRWGIYSPSRGLIESRRAPAINYLSHPELSAADLQSDLAEFLLSHVRELHDSSRKILRTVSISLGAPVNAHDMTVLGSGPLWGPTAKPFQLRARLCQALPECEWHVINDVTAMLAPYMRDDAPYRRTMLITVSSGIGSRLYDHQTHRIPYDAHFGVQGEIGHLVFPFEIDGQLIKRKCECGGWDHMNAFSSGRGIAQTLRQLPSVSSVYTELFSDTPDRWQRANDDYRLHTFQAQVEGGNPAAQRLLDAFVTPLSRALATALAVDPDIDRIVLTGGVVHGLGEHYRQALQRTFLRDGLYQITDHDPYYLARRLCWEDADDFSGLRGAGIFAMKVADMRN